MHVSACSFAASQASDLALLVGYVAYEDFNFNVSGHNRVWAQTRDGANVCGHKRVWAQSCVGTNVFGHNRVLAQSCVGTNVSVHKLVWAQSCVGTNVSGHKRVWAQTCLGTIVWAQVCMGTNVWSPSRTPSFFSVVPAALCQQFMSIIEFDSMSTFCECG